MFAKSWRFGSDSGSCFKYSYLTCSTFCGIPIVQLSKLFVTGCWKAPRVPLVYPRAVAAKSAYSHTSTFAPGPNLSSSHSVVGKLGGELDANGRQRSWLISPCD